MTDVRLGGRRAGPLAPVLDTGAFGTTLAMIILSATWVATWRPQTDRDLWWHLLIGEHVRSTGDVPRVDAVSWLTGGQPFVAHAWLWDVVMSAAYDVAGLMGTSLVALPVSALAIGLIWHLLGQTTPGIAPAPRAMLTGIAIVIGLPIWSPRSQIWDLVLVLAVATLWTAYLRRGTVWALWLVPLVPLAWVNLHGGSTLGFVACLLALLVAAPVGARWGTWPRRPWMPLVVSSAVALAAFALSPYGLATFLFPFGEGVGNAFQNAIAEWQSPDFSSLGAQALRVALAGAILVAFALRGRRRDPLFLLLAAGWLFLALEAVRFILIAGPLLVIALAPGMGGAIRSWTGLRPPAPRDGGAPRVVLAAGVLISLAIIAIGAVQIVPARQDAATASVYPVAAVDDLIARDCTGRILNAYDWGGYLAYRWRQPVGTYGSSPTAIVGEQSQLEALEVEPTAYLEEHGIDIVLVKADSPLAHWMRLAPGWTVAHDDPIAVTLTRDGASACRA